MKHQYFGDKYDYIKYGLLRQLSCHGRVSTSVWWMLTKNDDRRDGRRINYLRDPATWRGFDPLVFDCLRTSVLDRKERNVKVIEESGLLSNTTFYSHLLTDASDERGRYFDGFLEFAHGSDLVFFDPDNGLEIKSVKYGGKGASRYLFLQEVSQTFKAGHSLLVYQYMPREPRIPLIRDLTSRLLRETGSRQVYVFSDPQVAFFLAPQTTQVAHFAKIVNGIQSVWGEVLSISRFLDCELQ